MRHRSVDDARGYPRTASRCATAGAVRSLVVLGGVILGLWPHAALAHSTLISSQPVPGQRLSSAPGVVVLNFSESINIDLSRAEVISPAGRNFSSASVSSEQIQVPISGNEPGVYRVEWTTVSAVDGHVLRGSFVFGVGVSPGGTGEANSAALQTGDLLLAVARAVEFGALLLAMGLLLVRRLASHAPRLTWVAGPLVGATIVALVGGIAVVGGESAAAGGGAGPAGIASYLTGSDPGYARLLRLGFEAVALVLCLRGIRGVTFALLAAITSLAAAGHAAALRPAAPAIGLDAIHLASAGLWAGGILALATIRPPGGWLSLDARALLGRFTPVALVAFSVTALTGLIQAIEELSSPLDLLESAYGNVLAVKVFEIGLMLHLSLLAWRRLHPRPRVEATIAVIVISASALLAAFPLPPARFVEAESGLAGPEAALALPQPGDLTMGSNAGDSVVGLTVRPGRPGPNTLWVYMLPVAGEAAAAKTAVGIRVDGRAVTSRRCGPTCFTASISLDGGESIIVTLGAGRGEAAFNIPRLPAPDGTALVQSVQLAMHKLNTYRLDETLGPARVPLQTMYEFQAPDRLSYQLSTGGQTVIVGSVRYSRSNPTGPWLAEATLPIKVPEFAWDSAPIQDARIMSATAPGGEQVVSFFEALYGSPVWFRLTIGGDGLVSQAEMRARGHFMDHRYFDLDGAFSIVPPVA